LPESEWLALAADLIARGEVRLALRAYYLACLSALAGHGVVSIARYKTNRDYVRELQRRAHSWPEIIGAFASSATLFDRSWYGCHEVTDSTIEDIKGHLQQIRSHAKV
jgi:hypothetical protein